MKIGIDARLLERRMTGIGRYLENLIRYIPEYDEKNEYVLFSYNPLPGFPRENIRNVATLQTGAEGYLQKIQSVLWLHAILPRFIKREKIDLFFSPNSLLPIFGTGVKNVIAIYDVFQLIHPSFHSFVYRTYISFFLSRTLKHADHILTISEASKRDIVTLLRVPENMITVTYLAADERCMPRTISMEDRARYAKKYGLPARFILYLGVLEKRKNIDCIIYVADRLRDVADVGIVVGGRLGYGGEQYLEEIRARSTMRYIGFFDDADMPFIYNLAELFIFPSHYEGFGLPPLEAMRSGVPVIASNTSSLPEVVGDAGILLDPVAYGEYAGAVLKLLNNPNERAILIEKGLEQARKFSFRKTASATAAVLRSMESKS